MKNYFIANGEVLNINMSAEGVESRAQESLDEYTSGMAQFRIKGINGKEVRMFLVRGFNYDPDEPIIYGPDMALITGMGIGAFQLQAVGGYPMIHPLKFVGKNSYSDITSFIGFYKFRLFEETG